MTCLMLNHNLNPWWFIDKLTLANKLKWIIDHNLSKNFVKQRAFEIVFCKMSTICHISRKIGKCHSFWCPDSLHHKVISKNYCSLNRINRPLFHTGRNLKYLRHFNVEKYKTCKYIFMSLNWIQHDKGLLIFSLGAPSMANLTDPNLRSKWVKDVVQDIADRHLDGYNLDFERPILINKTKRDDLTSLVRELRQALSQILAHPQVSILLISFLYRIAIPMMFDLHQYLRL